MEVPTRVSRLCQQIELAFEHTPPPGIADDDISATPADDGVADYFRGRSWHYHTVKTLRRYSCALSYFTDKAFRYYLPAFMLAELKDHEVADVIWEGIEFRLHQDCAIPILESFSDAELLATAAFLEECIFRYDDVGGGCGVFS
jgi:hypothetical protein